MKNDIADPVEKFRVVHTMVGPYRSGTVFTLADFKARNACPASADPEKFYRAAINRLIKLDAIVTAPANAETVEPPVGPESALALGGLGELSEALMK